MGEVTSERPGAAAERRLRSLFGGYRIPSLPPTILDALERLRDEDGSMAAVAEAVERDADVAGRVLRTANSAAFSLRHRIRGVAHAVALLGRDELEAILISVAAGSVLPPLPAPGFVPARFWLAAARRAACAKSLAEIVDRPHRAASFTAALLQDVALPVLAHHGPPEHADVVARWHLGHAPLESLERERFNWDHARVGGWICAAWGLPLPICRAVAAHHGPPPEDDGAWQGNEPLPASTLVAAMPEIDDDGLARHMAGEWAERLGIELDEAAIRVGDAFQAASSLARELSPGPGATAPDAGIDAAT